MTPQQELEYLCEIAFCLGANIEKLIKHNELFSNNKFADTGKDYEDMVVFYKMILDEANKDLSCGLLDNCYSLINDTGRLEVLYKDFLYNTQPQWQSHNRS